jgi:hypothetical protein
MAENQMMTETLAYTQSGHLDEALLDPATKALNAGKLIGRWANTDPATRGIREITIAGDGDRFSVKVVGAGADGPIPWPSGAVQALANLEEEAGQRTVAFSVIFDLGFMKAETYLRVNKGVLVIVLFNTFHDGSGRSSYVTREFFFRLEN